MHLDTRDPPTTVLQPETKDRGNEPDGSGHKGTLRFSELAWKDKINTEVLIQQNNHGEHLNNFHF